MRHLLANIFLAVVWAASQGYITVANLVVGFALGYGLLWLVGGVFSSREYTTRVLHLIEFLLFFLWELVLANLWVAFEVVTPTFYLRTAIIALPLEAKTDLEITLLANLISLTPGTLSLDVSPDRRFLYIHAMFRHDAEREKQRLKEGFERRLLEVLR